ncbi:MAG: hypothetical protein IID45_00760 [Planctomycetes bacterium]|nr:hypothetical protein [Planctomycetota bacterium]
MLPIEIAVVDGLSFLKAQREEPLPILIVQHLPPMLTTMMAKHIQKDTGRPCQEGVDGGRIERGKTYIAPGGRHMPLLRISVVNSPGCRTNRGCVLRQDTRRARRR